MSRLLQVIIFGVWSFSTNAQVNIHTNQLGRLTSSGNGATRTFVQYDEQGRVVATQHVQESLSRVFTTAYGYPQNAQTTVGPGIVPLSESFPDGEQIVYSYDAGGQQVAMRSVFGTTIQDIVRGIRTNARGQVTRFELGNGTVTTRAYDDAGHQGLLLTTTVNSSGDKIQEYGYRYDPNFNVASVSDGVRGDQSVSYTYDALDQLTAVKNADGNPIESYSYDAIGNLVQKGVLEQIYGAGGRPHALASSGGVPYQYDGNGNVTSIGPQAQPQVELEWNPENMPTRVTAGSQVTQKSFVGESLWKKLEQGVTTNYLPGMHLENGVARKYYGGYAERLEDPNDRQLRFYHPDHLGSSSVMTDQNGNVIRRATYWPWGTERGVEGTFTPKQQFNGNEKDVAGFYDYGARLYNPVTGRWLSPDSELGDGLNRYAYVQNNPTSLTDPTGHQSQEPQSPCGKDAAFHNGECVPYPDVIEDVVTINVGYVDYFDAVLATRYRRPSGFSYITIANPEPRRDCDACHWSPTLTLGKRYSWRWEALASGRPGVTLYKDVYNDGTTAVWDQFINTEGVYVYDAFETAAVLRGGPLRAGRVRTLAAVGATPIRNFFLRRTAMRLARTNRKGLILDGHGHFDAANGWITLPKGTTLTFLTGPNRDITNSMVADILFASETRMASAIPRRIAAGEIDGAVTFLSGTRVPNLTLSAHPFKFVNTLTVTQPTQLSSILKEGMGHVTFAACTKGMPKCF